MRHSFQACRRIGSPLSKGPPPHLIEERRSKRTWIKCCRCRNTCRRPRKIEGQLRGGGTGKLWIVKKEIYWWDVPGVSSVHSAACKRVFNANFLFIGLDTLTSAQKGYFPSPCKPPRGHTPGGHQRTSAPAQRGCAPQQRKTQGKPKGLNKVGNGGPKEKGNGWLKAGLFLMII